MNHISAPVHSLSESPERRRASRLAGYCPIPRHARLHGTSLGRKKECRCSGKDEMSLANPEELDQWLHRTTRGPVGGH